MLQITRSRAATSRGAEGSDEVSGTSTEETFVPKMPKLSQIRGRLVPLHQYHLKNQYPPNTTQSTVQLDLRHTSGASLQLNLLHTPGASLNNPPPTSQTGPLPLPTSPTGPLPLPTSQTGPLPLPLSRCLSSRATQHTPLRSHSSKGHYMDILRTLHG